MNPSHTAIFQYGLLATLCCEEGSLSMWSISSIRLQFGIQQAEKDWKNHLRILPVLWECVTFRQVRKPTRIFLSTVIFWVCPSLSNIWGSWCWCLYGCVEGGKARKLVIKIKILPCSRPSFTTRAECISGTLPENTVSAFTVSSQKICLCLSAYLHMQAHTCFSTHMHTDALIYTVKLPQDVLSARNAELNKACQLPKILGMKVTKRVHLNASEKLTSPNFKLWCYSGLAR